LSTRSDKCPFLKGQIGKSKQPATNTMEHKGERERLSISKEKRQAKARDEGVTNFRL